MKSNRLDNVDWYDPLEDKLMCLECHRWYQMLEKHIITHFMTVLEYKHKYGILPKTPLRNKRLSQIASNTVKSLRDNGSFNVFSKGETSIPESWQMADTHKLYSDVGEFGVLVGNGLRGKRKSVLQIEKMRENGKKQDISHLKKYEFKKGQRPHNFGYRGAVI